MRRIYDDMLQLTGSTPIVEFHRLEKKEGIDARLLMKLECFNPTRSVKDRAVAVMLERAEAEGHLKRGGTVIIGADEGNTGTAVAFAAAVKGYKAVIVMPSSVSIEQRKLAAGYGAQIVLTPAAQGVQGAIQMAEKLAEETENAFFPGQFWDVENSGVHRKTTGPEIWQDTDGEIDIFAAGIGTGGTITGVGTYLREKKPQIRIAGVQKIQDIGAGSIPPKFNAEGYDEVVTVNDRQACEMAAYTARNEGILVGVSSGAVIYAATELAKRSENRGKTIVALLGDTGERYLSTGAYGAVLMPPDPF